MKTRTWGLRELIALVVIPVQLLAMWLMDSVMEVSRAVTMAVMFVLTAATMLVLIRLYKDILTTDWPGYRRKLGRNLLIGVGGAVALLGTLAGARAVMGAIFPDMLAAAGNNGASAAEPEVFFLLGMLFSFTPLFVAVQEELVFRYAFFYKHKDNKPLYAVLFVVSAVLFGLVHYHQTGGSILLAVPFIAAGAVFNAAYMITKNIWHVIVMHLIFNGVMGTLPGIFVPIMERIAN